MPRSIEDRGMHVAKKHGLSGVAEVVEKFEGQRYVADRQIGMAVYLSSELHKPLLVEGEPGCGKTDIARTLASALDTKLIRLQCYEGLDANATLYEWNYPKQLLTIRIEEKRKDAKELEKEIFSEAFLLKRPLLKALVHDGPRPVVLLIDEVDRADEEFEGLLLEFLSDFQITIPEAGTIRAKKVPYVVITSNRTRELSDALKRRCLYLHIGYPSLEKEIAILRRKVPSLAPQFAGEIAAFVQRMRAEEDFVKRPGISETLEWAAALLALGETKLTRETVQETLGFLVKDAQDLEAMRAGRLDALLGPA